MKDNYVDIPFENSLLALSWAKEYCPSYITNDAFSIAHEIDDKGRRAIEYRATYRFYFGNSTEQMLFALKWA